MKRMQAVAQKQGLSADEQKILNGLLKDAVEDRDIDGVKLYAQKGGDLKQTFKHRMDVDYPGGGGWECDVTIPLYQMVVLRGSGNLSDKDREISDFMLSKGVDVDTPNSEGWSALAILTMQGNVSRAKYLVEKGADARKPNAVEGKKMFDVGADTPFEIAAWLNKTNVCRAQLIELFITQIPDAGDTTSGAFNAAAVINDADTEGLTQITTTTRRGLSKDENANNNGTKGDALKL